MCGAGFALLIATQPQLTTPVKKLLLSSALLVALVGSQLANAATVTLTSVIGGAATGSVKQSFDSLAAGSSADVTLGAMTIDFSGASKVVNGSVGGQYAAPYVSNQNMLGFGPLFTGADNTNYLTVGAGANIKLSFTSTQKYFGLLWGSVDTYNSIKFYKGAAEVGSFTGANVTASANGNQGQNGTFYVSFNDVTVGGGFDSIVLRSSSNAFEFDNVSYNTRSNVPDAASTFGLLGLVVGAMAFLRRRK